jgi:hypothetical protein
MCLGKVDGDFFFRWGWLCWGGFLFRRERCGWLCGGVGVVLRGWMLGS